MCTHMNFKHNSSKMDRVVRSVRSLVLMTAALQLVGMTVAAPAANLISSLPGQPTVSFKQYSGYITVNQSHGRKLFYYFVEAANSSATAPLVLWLNGDRTQIQHSLNHDVPERGFPIDGQDLIRLGFSKMASLEFPGPGCSSLGGAFSELGPFYPNKTGDGLTFNNFGWNQVANVIFLESPAGVGFSYSNDTSDYNTGDNQTAQDSVAFLLGWLSEYPEYNLTDFYITGESYAGHYIPQLAAAILQNNDVPGQAQIILKGIIVGNPVFDWGIDLGYARCEYAWGHGMIDDDTHDAILKNCNWTAWPDNLSEACIAAIGIVNNDSLHLHYLNPYEVLEDVCLTSGQQALALKALFEGMDKTGTDPCVEDEMNTYLNRKDVEIAMHTQVSGWTQCSNGYTLNYTSDDIAMAPVLADLVNAKLRVWVYSGDLDLVVPVIGTRKIINTLAKTLNLTTTSTYQPWYQGSQIGGWTVNWGSLVYSTVRGAGHMVPGYQQARALQLLSSFLAGETLPLAPM